MRSSCTYVRKQFLMHFSSSPTPENQKENITRNSKTEGNNKGMILFTVFENIENTIFGVLRKPFFSLNSMLLYFSCFSGIKKVETNHVLKKQFLKTKL